MLHIRYFIYLIKSLLILYFIIRFLPLILNLVPQIFCFENDFLTPKEIHLNYFKWKIDSLFASFFDGGLGFWLFELFFLDCSHFMINFSSLLFLSYFLLLRHKSTSFIPFLRLILNNLIILYFFNYLRLYVHYLEITQWVYFPLFNSIQATLIIIFL